MANMAPSNIRLNRLGVAVIICLLLFLFLYVLSSRRSVLSINESVSMKELLSASIVLARRGGDRVRVIRRNDALETEKKGETKEGANEYVSKGDIESHDQIFYGLQKIFPGLNIVSEEHEKKPLDLSVIPNIDLHLPEVEGIKVDQKVPSNKITVWIDPLDATQEYTEMKDKAWAWVGIGHSANLAKGSPKDDTDKRIIVSRSHAGKVGDLATKTLGAVKITAAGGAGYKTLEVIKGNQDAYIHSTLIKKWDICAGNAILSALDGKMTTLDGKYIDYHRAEDAKNEGGLVATLYDHDLYVEKLQALKQS